MATAVFTGELLSPATTVLQLYKYTTHKKIIKFSLL